MWLFIRKFNIITFIDFEFFFVESKLHFLKKKIQKKKKSNIFKP
jgi:hypothetical protein